MSFGKSLAQLAGGDVGGGDARGGDGGANSHMAIRTAEFSLPAVIGVGEQKFDGIVKANVLEIDCSSQLIRKVR